MPYLRVSLDQLERRRASCFLTNSFNEHRDGTRLHMDEDTRVGRGIASTSALAVTIDLISPTKCTDVSRLNFGTSIALDKRRFQTLCPNFRGDSTLVRRFSDDRRLTPSGFGSWLCS